MSADLDSLIPLALIGSIGLAVGALVGFLLSGLRQASHLTKTKPSRDLIELMRIWRDRRSGQLSIQIGGNWYKRVDELNEKIRMGLARFLVDFQTWLNIPDVDQRISDVTSQNLAESTRGPDHLTPAESVVDRPIDSSTDTQASADALAQKILPPLSTQMGEPFPVVKSPSMEMADILAQAIAQENPKEAMQPPKSIAVQVDEILQERLASSPLRDRVIRLIELPEMGMVVIVDNAQYDGVGDVPEPEIRQLLRDSVAEWERRLSQ